MSSAAEHNMPRLSTPLIVPTPSVMFLPGMKVPGGENTLSMPVRALGAPQTTCTGAAPFPGSTMHARNGEGGKRPGLVLEALDLEPNHGEPVGELLDRLVGVEMVLQPGEREFHVLSPPASEGTSSGLKP